MGDLEGLVLSVLAAAGEIADSWTFAVEHGIDHQALVGIQKSLLGDAYTKEESLSTTLWSLSNEGEACLTSGSPEFRVYQSVSAHVGDGIDMSSLQAALGDDICKIGLGPCMKSKWLSKKGDKIMIAKEGVIDETVSILSTIALIVPRYPLSIIPTELESLSEVLDPRDDLGYK